ncbi:P-loop NTPase fold protein [Microbacterium sp. AG238]|uniref:P-loop NTPase fold protein n=1 Tax=Microbacterium sp. AG238 TaxID=2183994 RepID=UPI000E75FE7E|nr:P-loop NTPase fold protein [Microbacterium sp. AG238]RKE59969.1 KAP-like P-loop domain-containing protein [Microbacterium sp. AG238]
MVETSDSWFSDDAQAELAPTLGRASFVDRVWEVIRQTHATGSSTVFGLVGPWGSGKSSILEWLSAKAVSDGRGPTWLTVAFNPWDYQDAASLQSGFFAELAAAFGAHSTLDTARARFAAFGRTVAPFASIASLVGVDLSKAVEAASGLVAGDESTGAARAKLEAALRQAGTPVLVVVDDIDRVSAEELLLTLKLVRQLGRLPHVHYLLSYDETTILDVLTRTSLIGEQTPSRARDYMEKVVQVRFDIPALRPADATRMMNAGLEALSASGWLQLDETVSARFSAAYFGFMAARLNTPRSIKRYLAQIRLLSPTMAGEVDYVDFLVLTWLRTLEPGVYALLQSRREDLTGSGSRVSLGRRDDQATRDDAFQSWKSALLSSGTREQDLEGVSSAMAFLFPRFGQIWARAGSYAGEAIRPRIADESYFDRYFGFGLADDDVADASIRDTIDGLSSDGTSDHATLAHLTQAAVTNPALIVGKLAHELQAQREPTPRLIEWLARLHAALPAEHDFISPSRQLEAAIALQLRRAPGPTVPTLIQAVGSLSPELMATVVDRAGRDFRNETTSSLKLGDAEIAVVREVLADHFRSSDPLSLTISARSACWSWSRIDHSGFSEWVTSKRETYGDLDTLAFFVNVSVSMGTPQISRLRGLETEEAKNHLDLAALRIQFAEEIAAVGQVVADAFDGPLDTPAERRRVALAELGRVDLD